MKNLITNLIVAASLLVSAAPELWAEEDDLPNKAMKRSRAHFEKLLRQDKMCEAIATLKENVLVEEDRDGSPMYNDSPYYYALLAKYQHAKAAPLAATHQLERVVPWIRHVFFHALLIDDYNGKRPPCPSDGDYFDAGWLSALPRRPSDVEEPTPPPSPKNFPVAEVNDLGFWLAEAGDLKRAFSLLVTVVATDPKRAVAWLNLADILYDLGERSLAATAYTNYKALLLPTATIPPRVLERVKRPSRSSSTFETVEVLNDRATVVASIDEADGRFIEVMWDKVRFGRSDERDSLELDGNSALLSVPIVAKEAVLLDGTYLPKEASVTLILSYGLGRGSRHRYLPATAPVAYQYWDINPGLIPFATRPAQTYPKNPGSEPFDEVEVFVPIAKAFTFKDLVVPPGGLVIVREGKVRNVANAKPITLGKYQLKGIGYDEEGKPCAYHFVGPSEMGGYRVLEIGFCMTYGSMVLSEDQTIFGVTFAAKSRVVFVRKSGFLDLKFPIDPMTLERVYSVNGGGVCASNPQKRVHDFNFANGKPVLPEGCALP